MDCSRVQPRYVSLLEPDFLAVSSSSSCSNCPSGGAPACCPQLRQPQQQRQKQGPRAKRRKHLSSLLLLALPILLVQLLLTTHSNKISRSGSDLSFSSPAAPRPVNVALTRPTGENRPLAVALERAMLTQGMQPELAQCIEVPCIEHGPGPDKQRFEEDLMQLQDQTIVLTSPTGAQTFLEAWAVAVKLATKSGETSDPLAPASDASAPRSPTGSGDQPDTQPESDIDNDYVAARDFKELPKFEGRVVCLGKGTAKVLEKAGIDVQFMPSKADAETLAAELPVELGPKVVYPASEIAPDTLQTGLASRGFSVTRYDAYTTRPVQNPSKQLLAAMETTEVVTFSSPSSVDAWTKHSPNRPLCACIGDTSKKAAEDSGFPGLFAPQSPGLEGWATALVDAIKVHLLLRNDVDDSGKSTIVA